MEKLEQVSVKVSVRVTEIVEIELFTQKAINKEIPYFKNKLFYVIIYREETKIPKVLRKANEPFMNISEKAIMTDGKKWCNITASLPLMKMKYKVITDIPKELNDMINDAFFSADNF